MPILKRINFCIIRRWIILLIYLNLLSNSCINANHALKSVGCNHNEFECKSDNLCIPLTKVQDGVNDCSDASDEKCRTDQHICHCGIPKCVDKQLVGNGVHDCQDGSDEGDLLPCDEKKLSGDVITTIPTKSLQLLHKQSISEESISEDSISADPTLKLSQTYTIGSFSSDHVSHSAPVRILVEQEIFDKQPVEGIKASILSKSVEPSNSFVELTGTFVPFEELSTIAGVSPINYYTSNDGQTRTVDSLIEITGTFIPEIQSLGPSPQIDPMADNKLAQNDVESNLAERSNNNHNYITVTGTKETFVTDDNTFNLITGTYVEQKSSYLFLFGNRQMSTTSVGLMDKEKDDSLIIYETDLKQRNNSVGLKLDEGELALILPTSVHQAFDKKANNTNDRLLYGKAQKDGQVITGLFVEGVTNIAVTGAQKAKSKSDQNISLLMVTLNKERPNNVLLKQKRKEIKPILQTPTKSMQLQYISTETLNKVSSSERENRNFNLNGQSVVGRKIEDGEISILTDQLIIPHKADMLTKTVGIDVNGKTDVPTQAVGIGANENLPKFNVNHPQSSRTKATPQLDDQTLLIRKAPVYTPSKIETVSQSKRTQGLNEELNKVRHKTTIFGFIDFTTTINNTEVVFMPATRALQQNVQKMQSKIPSNSRQITTALKQNPETKAPIKPLFLSSVREFVSQDFMTTSTIQPTASSASMAESMFTSTVAESKQDLGKEVDTERVDVFYNAESQSKDSLKDSTEISLNQITSMSSSFENQIMSSMQSIEPSLTSSQYHLNLPTGLLSTITGSNELEGTMTEWTTSIIGTYIKGTYAHILQSTSRIYPKKTTRVPDPQISSSNKLAEKIEPTKSSEIIGLESTSLSSGRDDNLKEFDILGNNKAVPPVFIEGSIGIESGMTQPSLTDPIYSSIDSNKISAIPNLYSPSRVTITSGFILPTNQGLGEQTLQSSAQFLDQSRATPVLKRIPGNQNSGSQSVQNVTNTFLTTYTYFTTHLKDGSTLIDSRYETVTNVETPTVQSVVEVKPTTYYTRFTFFTTTIKNGQTFINSHIETSSNVVYETISNPDQLLPTKPLTTYYTTYTYYTTFKKGDTEFVKSREEIVTNLVPNTIEAPLSTETIGQSINTLTTIQPSITYFTTYTLFTTLVNSGKTTITTSKSTETNVVTLPTIDPSNNQENIIRPTASEQLKSDLTTLTYFTTYFKDGNPSVDSRTIVITKTLDANEISSESPNLNEVPVLESSQNHKPLISSITTPLEGSLITSLNLGKLLSGLAVPITHYTTFTYFTTFFKDQTSGIISRTEVISNIITGTINLGLTQDSSIPSINQMIDNSADSSKSSTLNLSVTKVEKDLDPLTVEAAENTPIIITPVTFFTTTTYFTTLLLPGHGSSIISSTQVLSSVFLPGPSDVLPIPAADPHYHHMRLNPSITERHEARIIHSTVDDRVHATHLPAFNNRPAQPETVYTTFTYFTTRFANGNPVVDTSYETFSNIITKTITIPQIETRSQTETKPNDDPYSRTLRTTYTYLTTRFVNGTAIVSENKETFTNVVPNQLLATESPIPVGISPTRTRKPIVVTRTRVAGSGVQPALPGSRRPIVIVRRRPEEGPQNIPLRISGQFRSENRDGIEPHLRIQPHSAAHNHFDFFNTSNELGRRFPVVSPTPVTYYTTYTYFTTELQDGRPVVRSREQLFSTIITGKILPTRIIPSEEIRHKRSAFYDQNYDREGAEKDRIDSSMNVEEDLKSNTFGMREKLVEFTDVYLKDDLTQLPLSDQTLANNVQTISLNNESPSDTLSTNHLNTLNPTQTLSLQTEESAETVLKDMSSLQFPTGVISEKSEIRSTNGLQTIVTEIYGTFINGFYAQFAITRTVTPSSSIENTLDTKQIVASSTQLLITSSTQFMLNQMESISTIDHVDNTSSSNLSLEQIIPSSTQQSIESSSLTWLSIAELTNTENVDNEDNTDNTENTINSDIEPIFPSSVSSSQQIAIETENLTSTEELKSSTGSYSTFLFETGLISSSVETAINNNKTTLITSEIYGTYINGIYAHLAKTRTQVLSNLPTLITSPSTISSTSISTSAQTNNILMPSVVVSSNNPEVNQSAAMLQTSIFMNEIIENVQQIKDNETNSKTSQVPPENPTRVQIFTDSGITRTLSTDINYNKTTIYTTDILTTNISGLIAHYGQVSSTVIEPWTSLPGLASISTSTETINQTITLHTTEFYTTEINGFTAYYSRSTSNVIGSINKTETSEPIKTSSLRPFIHFPTPVRFLFSSKHTSTISPTSTITATTTIGSDQTSTESPLNNIPDHRDPEEYDNNYFDEYYDESAERGEEHTPRSRPIREKDSQPLIEYDYEEVAQPAFETPKTPEIIIPYRGHINHNNRPSVLSTSRNNARQVPLSRQSNTPTARRASVGGFGQRVGIGQRNPPPNFHTPQESRQDYPMDVQPRDPEVPVQNTPRLTRQRVMSVVTRMRRPITRTSTIAPTRVFDNDYDQTLPEHRNDRENRREDNQNNRNDRDEWNDRNEHYDRNDRNGRNDRRQQNPNRVTTRRRMPFTTTTTPAPRSFPVLPNRRRLNRKYNGRTRFSGTSITPTRGYSEETSSRYRNDNYNGDRRRTHQRGRTIKTTVLFLNKPQSTRSTEEYDFPSSSLLTTPTLPKVPLTVTSIVTTVKTIPIFHGFKTSYATLTTTTLNSSTIQTDQYETTVNPIDGMTKTVFTRSTDSIEPTKVTEVLVTTTALSEIKLIPIRIGFSTRTETVTDIKKFTMLTTIVTSQTVPTSIINPVFIQGQQPGLPYLGAAPGLPYTLFTTTNSFITTQTLSSTTVVSILLRGKTLLSTLTLTSLTESTITTTQTISIPITQHVPFPVHPQPITTLLTLSITGDSGDITELVTAVTVPIQPVFHTKVERDVKATSSVSVLMQQTLGSNYNSFGTDSIDYISASFKTVDQLLPTDPFFITTISKGPETEIYQASATVVKKDKPTKKKIVEDKYTTTFKKRKLQQFANDNNFGYAFVPKPVRLRDYSRINFKHQSHNLEADQNDPIPDFVELDNPSRFQTLTQAVPQRNPLNGRQPSFHRIRINTPAQAQALPRIPASQLAPLSSPNEAGPLRFQRIIGLQRRPDSNIPATGSTPVRVAPQGGFRRVPVFNNQIPALPPLQPKLVRETTRPPLIEPTNTDVFVSTALLAPTATPLIDDQRQTFRRVRPIQTQGLSGQNNGQNGRRGKPKVKVSTRHPNPNSTPLPTSILVSSVEVSLLPVSDVIDIPRRGPITRKPTVETEGTTPPALVTTPGPTSTPELKRETTTDQPRRVVRIRRPNNSANTSRKRVVLLKNPSSPSNTNELQARGPVPARDDEPSRNNAVDGDEISFNTGFGTRLNDNVQIEKSISPAHEIHTPTIPLTYFTTFTYLTTVVRGQHTAHLSRESVTSTVSTEALDKTIVDIIQNSDGIISPTRVVELGTKTKGVTTTIVNLVSKVQVFNDDLYKVIQSTKPSLIEATVKQSQPQPIQTAKQSQLQSIQSVKQSQSQPIQSVTKKHEPIQIKSTSVKSEPFVSKSAQHYKIADLESIPKKQFTYFTYYYTLHDQQNTKYSTRAEVISSDVPANGQLSTLKLDSTVNSDGLLSVGSGPETVHLGSRALGGLTTEVNLALNTYIKFDGISNAIIEPSPTKLPEFSSEPTTSLPETTTEPTLLSGSFTTVSTSDQVSSISTPSIPLETELKLQSHTRKPVKLLSSAVIIRDPLRSKFEAINGRPGVRVRVKPVSDSKNTILRTSSTLEKILKSSKSEPEISPTPTLVESSTEIISSSDERNKDTLKQVTPTKKRIAVTLRRPFTGNNRLSTRKPIRVQSSTKPRLVVVTRTGPLASVQSTASRIKISSRVFKSPVASLETTSLPSVQQIKPTLTVNELGQTLSLTVTTVPVIFGLDTSYRTYTLTSTLSSDALSSTTPLSSVKVEDPSVVTYLETTTHTVPFTVGDHTIYTTVEETNSRVITGTLESVDPSDAARANRFMKVSNGVTLIVGSNVGQDHTLSTPFTLQPTLVTGAAVHMRDGIQTDSEKSSKSSTSTSLDSSSLMSSLGLATLFDTRTLYTTFTYFTTFYTDDTSIISSSEQTVSDVVTIPYTHIVPTSSLAETASPVVVYETTERLRTSTVYSTYTYFATLFNGSTSTITPLEEIKTELFTVREPITVTRTIRPTQTTDLTTAPTLFTRTYYTTYTNLITFFHNNRPVTSTIEETVSSEVVYTVPHTTTSPSSTSSSSLIRPTGIVESPVLRTRSTYTTLTHFITLFSGSQTILSSIEEISPTVVTEVAGQTVEPTSEVVPNIRFTQPSQSIPKQSKDLFSALVQSISTLFTTHTYFTTLFSGTTSTVISRKETSSSLVTLYVPHSLATKSAIMPSEPITSSSTIYSDPVDSSESPYSESDSEESTQYRVEPTPILESSGDMQVITAVSANVETQVGETSQVGDVVFVDSSINAKASSVSRAIQPSLRIDSSRYDILESKIISKVFEDLQSSEGLTEEQLSSVVAEVGGSTTIIDGSTIVFFTNFILPSSTSDDVMPTEVNNNNIAKGPAGDLVSSLLNHADMSLLNDLLASRISSVGNTASPVYISPNLASQSGSETSAIQPGSVIELSDLLDGANLAGNIGEAIKDIVHILAKAPKSKNTTQDDVERISPSKELPPREGVAVSNSQDPVYIPLGAVHKPSVSDTSLPESETVIGERNTKQISSKSTRRTEIIASRTVGLDDSTSLASPTIASTYSSDGLLIESSLETTPRVSHSTSLESQRPTPLLSSAKVIPTSHSPKTVISRVSSGATTIFFTNSAQRAAQMPSFVDSNTRVESTKYVTSVESTTRTLTLTTTKVYYTRDSPLTITSVLTTTIPPRTFVSTIIGTRTILGTAGESQTETVQPTQVQKADLATTVTKKLTPFQRPTRKPGQGLFKPPTRGPETTQAFRTSSPRPRVPYKPSPTRPPFISGVNDGSSATNKKPTIATTHKPTTRPSILDYDQCKPACNAANKEVCKEIDGKYRCGCRQGFIKRNDDPVCHELQNYVVVVRVMKVGESEVTWFSEFSNNSSNEYQNLAKMAKKQVDNAYMSTDVKESYVGADVLSIDKVNDGGNGVLVNLTVHLTKRNDLDEDLLREELIKTLEKNSEILPNPQYVSADVEDVIDFDECSSDEYNDCAASARCINEPGSYRCECLNGYPDLDLSFPGRVCASEIKGCEFCHGRGDCVRDDSGQVSTCKCHRMYLGRRCEINGLLLAILLPIAAILCIISICCIVYCCRKWRKRTISKGFRNLSSFGPTVIGGTLDRKAMLETSSESSDHLRSHVYDGPGILPSDPNGSNDSHRRRESEPSLDRSMGSVGGAFNSLPPQIVIPRARHSSQQAFFASETLDSMSSQFIENIPTSSQRNMILCRETSQRPDIYSPTNRHRNYDIQSSSRPTSKYSRNSGITDCTQSSPRFEDNKSMNSFKSSSMVSNGRSSLYQISGQRLAKYDWDWKTIQRARYTESLSRPKSQSEILRNTISETGRSIDETVLHPPTHIRDDTPVNVRHYARFTSKGSDMSGGVTYDTNSKKSLKNNYLCLSQDISQQHSNTNFKLFYDHTNEM